LHDFCFGVEISPLRWRYHEPAEGELKVRIAGFNPQLGPEYIITWE